MLSGMESDGSRAAREYEAMARVYADDVERNPTNVSYERPQMLAMAGDLGGRRVLDAGCAAGSLSAAMVALGASVVGVDISESLVQIASDRLGSHAEFHVADLAAPLPFLADRSFDIVTASLVLHYLRDWNQTLREFNRVLRPDGVLLISTHHPTYDVEIADPPAPYFETTLLTDTWRKGGRDFEVRFYHRPLSAIIDALADAGFLVERIPEPIPDRNAFAASPAFYDRMRRVPWFLFIRAVKRPSPPSL
jgi:2-polyprenyl-3-methyl-5-hydroxy-6-metoxy-1,4-benzoquinol methylase